MEGVTIRKDRSWEKGRENGGCLDVRGKKY